MIQIKKIVNTNDIVSIRSLNLSDEDSIRDLLIEADFAIQYGENIEPDDKAYEQAEKALNGNNGMSMNFDDGMWFWLDFLLCFFEF